MLKSSVSNFCSLFFVCFCESRERERLLIGRPENTGMVIYCCCLCWGRSKSKVLSTCIVPPQSLIIWIKWQLHTYGLAYDLNNDGHNSINFFKGTNRLVIDVWNAEQEERNAWFQKQTTFLFMLTGWRHPSQPCNGEVLQSKFLLQILTINE